MRATRVGGSFSSSARACGATILKSPAKHSSSPSLLLPVNVFMTNPLFSDRTASLFELTRASVPADGSVTPSGSHRIEHHNGKEVARRVGSGPSANTEPDLAPTF